MGAVSLVVCIKRNPKLSQAEFSEHWRNTHAPMIAACEQFNRHLLDYVQYHQPDDSSPGAAQFGTSGGFDGIAVLTFRTQEAMAQAFAEPAYLADVQPDEARFVDTDNCVSYLLNGFSVLGKGKE